MREIKTSKGVRLVSSKPKTDFARNRSDVFSVPNINNAISQANPLESIGMGVHRTQAKEFNEYYKSEKISGAYHKPDGTAVFESRQARNAVLKLRNCRDNDAGYGDHSGEN